MRWALLAIVLALGCAAGERRPRVPATDPPTDEARDAAPRPAPPRVEDAAVALDLAADLAAPPDLAAPDLRVADAASAPDAADSRATSSGGTDSGTDAGAGGALHGARWDMPCHAAPRNTLCGLYPPGTQTCPAAGYTSVDRTITFDGTKGTVYDVTIRFRGVMETGDYTGGTSDTEGFRVGGTIRPGLHNAVKLAVSAPAQVYYPNSKGGGGSVNKLDYTRTIRVEGGAMIKLTAFDSDCLQHVQSDPMIPGVPAPRPHGGNFIQMDVVSVAAAK